MGGKKILTQQEFEDKANKIQGIGEFDYSIEPYFRNKKHIKMKHNKCGTIIFQTPHDHLKGYGCSKCAGNVKLNTLSFLIKIILKFPHNIMLYKYSEIIYKSYDAAMKIFCYKCNDYFTQTPHDHLKGYGCSKCEKSKNEQKIKFILKQNNIIFESQKRFETCKNKRTLPFDFYLIDYNILIEFDGKQHFKPMSFSNNISQIQIQKNFEEIQYRDSIKTNWAKQNNIPLLRISYKEQHLIEEKINKLIKFLKTNII